MKRFIYFLLPLPALLSSCFEFGSSGPVAVGAWRIDNQSDCKLSVVAEYLPHGQTVMRTLSLELEPDADFILDSLAWVHFRRGELDDAWEQIQKALDASDKDGPGDPAMFEHYGDIASARGDRESARHGWQKALELFQSMDFPEDAARVRLKLEKH